MSDPREILNRIREQANAATPGPWEWEGESEEMWPTGDNSLRAVGGADPEFVLMAWGYDAYGITAQSDEDAEFIAAARTTVPALLDALEKVLELHQPVTDGMGFTEDGYGGISPACSSCGTSDEYAVPYPCPTVTAITTALEATK